MNLPCDADWSGKEDPEARAERIRLAIEEKDKLKKLIALKKREAIEREEERKEEETNAKFDKMKDESWV